MVVVPQDQPTRLILETPRRLRMNSTTAATSRTASRVSANGGLAAGGCSIAAGRVERPYPRTSTEYASKPRRATKSIHEPPGSSMSNPVSEGKVPPCTKSTMRSGRSEEHTSELQSRENLVCRLLLEKKKQ